MKTSIFLAIISLATAAHYERPPCGSDELQGQLQGANGTLCAPKCDSSGGCPTDVPANPWPAKVAAKPKCILQDQSGGKYCALTCEAIGCPAGAKCAMIAVVMGVCVYPNGTATNPLSLSVNKAMLPEPSLTAETQAIAPATSHYEKPPCQADELQGQLQGANGTLCAPKCDASGGCPADVPANPWPAKVAAKPKCILQDQSGGKYCALTCEAVGCPAGAKCAMIAVVMGVCVYPNGTMTNPLPLTMNKEAVKALPAPSDAKEASSVAPATSHYEKPPCQADELQGQLQGANGTLCAPKCDASGGCPTDIPANPWPAKVAAKPKCILQDQSGGKYCALTCEAVGCPTGAKCAMIAVVMGVCVYPNGTMTNALPLSLDAQTSEQMQMSIVV